MGMLGAKKRILAALTGFAGIMAACTVISKGIYAHQLPCVETAALQKGTIGHVVEAEGYIEAGGESAVSAIPGLKVERIYVRQGESVSENTLLFDVDQEQLAEEIAQQELAVGKLELEIQQLRQTQELEKQKELLAQNRSLEDYALTDTQEERKIAQAEQRVERVEEDLREHEAEEPSVTPEEERKEREKEYESWREERIELQKQLLKAQDAQEQALQEEEAAKVALEEYQRQLEESGEEGEGTDGEERTETVEDGKAETDQKPAEEGAKPETTAGELTVGEASIGERNEEEAGGLEEETKEDMEGELEAERVPDTDMETEEDIQTQINTQTDAEKKEPAADGEEEESPGSDETLKQLEEAAAWASSRRQEAQERVRKLERALEDRGLEERLKPDFSSEDAARTSWENTKESLEDALEDAQTAKEDSIWDKLDAMLEAKRRVEDAMLPGQISLQIRINEMELSFRREILDKYRALESAQGRIYSEEAGIVTEIGISSGDPLTEHAALKLARLDESFCFRAVLSKEQAKYVGTGDSVSLKLGNTGTQIQAEIGYWEENASAPGSYEAVIYLPEGVGTIGMRAVLTASSQSGSYSAIIPATAVHRENERDYCYVVHRQQGILGEELVVFRTAVRVLDENSRYVAIEEGSLDPESDVVISSTRELADGKTVRYAGLDDADSAAP